MIKGKITVLHPTSWLRYLPQGATTYIVALEVAVTRKAIFVPWEGAALTPERWQRCIDEDFPIPCVKVTKIGKGVKHSDFEFDFSDCNQDPDCLVLQADKLYNGLAKNPDYLLVPLGPEHLVIVTNEQEPTLEELEEECRIALKDENYELVNRLQGKIEQMKHGTK